LVRTRARIREGTLSLRKHVHTDSGAHSASYTMCTRGSSPGVERPGRKADHSSPSTADVKSTRSYTFILQHVFIAWCLIKHRIRLHGVLLG